MKTHTSKITDESSEYMRPAEAMRFAKVSRRTLSDWQKRRIIPFLKVSHKVVLFRKSDIIKALTRFEVKAV